MNRKALFAVMVLFCSQFNSIHTMSTLSALKDSALKNKHTACLFAGGALAVATSVASAAYCYWIKGYYKKQDTLLTTKFNAAKEKIRNIDALAKDYEMLSNLYLIQPFIKSQLSESPLRVQFTLIEPLNVLKKMLEGRKNVPENALVCCDLAITKIQNPAALGSAQDTDVLKNIEESHWYEQISKELVEECDRNKQQKVNLTEEKNTIKEQQAQLPAQHAHSWKKLWRTMGLGYLAVFGLGLYGYLSPQKA